ncbi:MAG TPA: GxxExxY protein [Bacteroidia bacterium]|nr:GxxExxY protein [Bacteroidia bacterium]
MTLVSKRDDLIYPELCYEIVGCAYDVYNSLGTGLKESTYQKALGISMRNKNHIVEEQIPLEIRYAGQSIGRRYLDFRVDKKIIVEIKKGGRYSKNYIDQVVEYLKISGLKLAILIDFGKDGVIFKRLVNLDSNNSVK